MKYTIASTGQLVSAKIDMARYAEAGGSMRTLYPYGFCKVEGFGGRELRLPTLE
jgi:hypothetical protein